MNPERFGIPAFDEFKKDPDKYRKRPDDLFASADASTQTFREVLRKQRYFWKNEYEANSLEEIERICREEGISYDSLNMCPAVVPVEAGKFDIFVSFWPKEPLIVA